MDKLEQFWKIVHEVWTQGWAGVDIGKLLTALGILVVFLLLRRLFTKFILDRLQSLTAKTETTIDDHSLKALNKPVSFVPIVMGLFFALEYLELKGPLAVFSNHLLKSLIVVVIFWAVFNMIQPLSLFLKRMEEIFTTPVVVWFVKTIKGAVVFVGAATVLEIWGIEIGPIIAGLGLFGVAVALGAQDLFKNLISGLLILVERRFSVGDWIRVDGVVEGTVENINFRSTLVRRFDQAPVFGPNHKLADNAVTNFSAMMHRRIFWAIGLEYRTTIDQLRTVRNEIEEYILENPDFVNPPKAPLFVRVDKFNNSSIDLMLYCFTETTVWGDWLKIKEALALKVKEVVEKAGCAFAFPSTSLYVEALPEDRPEIFTAPQEKEKQKQS
jgi:MscS family membrane protein